MLKSRARTRSGSVAEAMRAKIVLSLAAGYSQAHTSRTVDCSINTVRLWKERFLKERLGGLYGRHRGRSRSKESVRLEARVLQLAQHKPADGSTHWSTRKIASEVGTNHVRVTRILAKAGLQPHRLRRYLPVTIQSSRKKPLISSVCISSHRSMQRYSASTRKVRFKHWIGWIRCYP